MTEVVSTFDLYHESQMKGDNISKTYFIDSFVFMPIDKTTMKTSHCGCCYEYI